MKTAHYIFLLFSTLSGITAFAADSVSLKRGETITINCASGTSIDVLSKRGSSSTLQCGVVCKVSVIRETINGGCAGEEYGIHTTVPGQSTVNRECGIDNARLAAEKIVRDWEAYNGCDRIVTSGF